MAEHPPKKWDYIYYAMIAGTIVFFAMALVGFVGELLGWWNDVGEVLMGVGTAGGALLGGATLVVGSSRSQVEATREAVESTRNAVESTRDAVESTRDAVGSTKDAVGSTREAVESNGAKLDSVDAELSQQTRILAEIRDRL